MIFNIPKPCAEKFSSMTGDDRARHCAKCNKMVHNLSAVSSDEARDLLRSRGKICVTCSVDGSGEVITTDYEEIQEKRLMVAQFAVAACLLLGLYGMVGPVVAPLLVKPSAQYIGGDAISLPREQGQLRASPDTGTTGVATE